MITLREMKYAITLAKFGNFSKAAAELYISQPSLSQAIKKMEQELGVLLFERAGNSFSLTPHGALFVTEAMRILSMTEEMEKKLRKLSEEHAQKIVFGISPFYGRYYLPKFLPQFKKEHPHIDVTVVESSSTVMEAQLKENQIDIAFLPLPLRDSELKYLTVLDEEIYFAIPRNAPVAAEIPKTKGKELPTVHLSMFRDMPFICLKNRQRFTELGNALCQEEGFLPQVAFESENWDTVDALIAKGMGVGFAPEALVNDNVNDPLKPLYMHIASPNNRRKYVAAYTDERKLTKPILDLISIISAMKSPLG